jgi:hypothetical protein
MLFRFRVPDKHCQTSRRAKSRVAMFIALCMVANPAKATIWCDGKITQFYTDSSGNFMILPTFRGDWVQICSVQSEWKGISTQICNTWVATVISGTLASKVFTMVYTDLGDCLQIPSYSSAPAPAYVRLTQ